jgi:hypothetical protein
MTDFSIVLTVADHEKNGFVTLAKTNRITEEEARRFISAVDDVVDPEAEPGADASFAFVADLVSGDGDLVDTGTRLLPLQLAMAIAPEAVSTWLEERPDPNRVMHRPPLMIAMDDLLRRVPGGRNGRS